MRIVLLGYMGSGKSTVGRALAKRLELPFIDLDVYIEEKEKMSIPDIFAQKGELYFRKTEHRLLLELLKTEGDFILSLGGGTPAYAGNMDHVVSDTSNSFYLQHTVPSLVERLSAEKEERPLIAHLEEAELPEFIGKHIFDRGPYYQQASHTLHCGNKTPEQLVLEIEAKLV